MQRRRGVRRSTRRPRRPAWPKQRGNEGLSKNEMAGVQIGESEVVMGRRFAVRPRGRWMRFANRSLRVAGAPAPEPPAGWGRGEGGLAVGGGEGAGGDETVGVAAATGVAEASAIGRTGGAGGTCTAGAVGASSRVAARLPKSVAPAMVKPEPRMMWAVPRNMV